MPARHAVRRVFLIALLSAAVWSCSSRADSEEPPEPPPLDDEVTLPTEATVDVGAGRLSVAAIKNTQAEALRVAFPRGSVEAPAQVTLRAADLQVAGLPDDAIIAAFEIEGTDDRLARKAQLFFDAAPESQAPPNAAVFFLKENGRLEIEQQCEREMAEMIQACSALEDWMVLSTIGAGANPSVACGTADCSGAIDASEQRGDDPFTSITKTLDKQCDNSEPIICQLECYGWSP